MHVPLIVIFKMRHNIRNQMFHATSSHLENNKIDNINEHFSTLIKNKDHYFLKTIPTHTKKHHFLCVKLPQINPILTASAHYFIK